MFLQKWNMKAETTNLPVVLTYLPKINLIHSVIMTIFEVIITHLVQSLVKKNETKEVMSKNVIWYKEKFCRIKDVARCVSVG